MKIKYLILSLIIGLSPNQINCQSILKGRTLIKDSSIVYFNYFENGKYLKDSTLVKNGEFNFLFSNIDQKIGFINVSNTLGYFKLAIDNLTEIFLNDKEIWNSNITSGILANEYASINKYNDSLENEIKKSYQKRNSRYDNINSLKSDSQLIKINSEKILDFKKEFIKKNPNNVISLFFLNDIKFSITTNELFNLFLKIESQFLNHNYNIYLRRYIDKKYAKENNLKLGNRFLEINLIDLYGNPFALDLVSSKYLLLNFWGTWCGPCFEELPFLKKINKKIPPSIISLIGVAYEQEDYTIEKFKRYLKSNKITWKNFIAINNSKTNNINLAFLKKIGITSYPTSLLIRTSDKEIVWKSEGFNNFFDLEKIISKKE